MKEKKNIAFINGKRLNYCSEIQALEFGKDSDTLKSLISGEPTEARPIYGDNFTAYNIPFVDGKCQPNAIFERLELWNETAYLHYSF